MKTIFFSAGMAWIGRVLAILTNLLGVSLAYSRLGEESFGLLLIAISIGSWVGMLNLTFGRALTTIIAKHRHDSLRFVRQSIRSSLAISATINSVSVLICTAGILIYVFMFPTEAIARHQIAFVVTVIFIFIGVSLWGYLSIFEAVEAGHQTIFRLSLYQNASYIFSLFLLFAILPWAPSIPLAAYILCLSFLLGSICHAFDVSRRYAYIFEEAGPASRRLVSGLVRNTFDFVAIYFCLSLMYQTSVGMIGLFFEPGEIIELGLVMRIAQALLSITFGLLYPMASAITGRLAARDTAGAISAARGSLAIIALGSGAGAIGMWKFGAAVFLLWTGRVTVFAPGFAESASVLFFLLPLHAYLLWLLVGLEHASSVAKAHLVQGLAFCLLAPVLFATFGQTGVLIAIDLGLVVGIVAMARIAFAHADACAFMRAALNAPGFLPGRAGLQRVAPSTAGE